MPHLLVEVRLAALCGGGGGLVVLQTVLAVVPAPIHSLRKFKEKNRFIQLAGFTVYYCIQTLNIKGVEHPPVSNSSVNIFF